MTPNRFPSACVEYKPSSTLEALNVKDYPSFYWAHVLANTLDGIPELNLPAMKGVILAGPPGNGRHTIAMRLSGSLAQRNWPFFARISGITLDTEDVADACAVLKGAVAKLQQHGGLCLLLDCPENSRHSLAIQEYLRQQMDYYPGRIFPIIITDSLTNITPTLQTPSIASCQFQSPDRTTRQRWLQTYLEGKISIDGGVNYITLTKETNGFTWRQLTDLRTMLRRAVALKYSMNTAAYENLGPRETVLTNGSVHLTRDEGYTILSGIRSQALPVAAAAGAVQYVSPIPPVPGTTVVPGPTTDPGTTTTPGTAAPPPANKVMTDQEKADAKALMDFHGHPEKMSFGQLTDIDDL